MLPALAHGARSDHTQCYLMDMRSAEGDASAKSGCGQRNRHGPIRNRGGNLAPSTD